MFTTALASTLKERGVVLQVVCGTEDGEQSFSTGREGILSQQGHYSSKKKSTYALLMF